MSRLGFEMTASRRLLPPLTPAPLPPLEVEDLLMEILLRLSPLPSSLPRASAVCKRWGHLISDPDFFRRFRLHQRPNPPLLGFFVTEQMRRLYGFLPLMRPGVPDLVLTNRFSQNQILSCRHGLLLIFLVEEYQFQVWDPVTGVRHCIDPPPAQSLSAQVNGAVLRDARVDDHFKIVLVVVEGPRAIACVYSSETSEWGDLVSTMLPPKVYTGGPPAMGFSKMHALLVENSLHWLLSDVLTNFSEAFIGVPCASSILEFDVVRQSLTVERVPADVHHTKDYEISVITERGGGLGLLTLSGCNAHIWKRSSERDGDTSWVLGRTIKLCNLLCPNPQKDAGHISIKGFAEYNHVVLLSTSIYYYTVQLESLEVRRFQCIGSRYHPFESVYTTGNDGRPDVADFHSTLKRMVRLIDDVLVEQVSLWSLEMKKRDADYHTTSFLLFSADKHSGMKVEGTLACFHKSVLTMRWARLSVDLVCSLVRVHLLVDLITFHVVSSMEFSTLYFCISVFMLSF